jgi:hypothetical protein
MACVIPPLFLLCLFLTTMSSLLLAVQTTKEIDSYGRDYYVFTPDKIDPARTYWPRCESILGCTEARGRRIPSAVFD